MVEGNIVEGFLGEHRRSNQVYKCIAVKLNVVKKSLGNLEAGIIATVEKIISFDCTLITLL